MAASLGSLVVSLGLDAAEFTAGLSKAEYQARRFGESIGSGIRSAALIGAAAVTGVAAAALSANAAFNELLDGAAKFQDLAEETGASAEGIAGLAVAAGTAGVNIESVTGSMIKLTKGLAGVDDESKAAGAALAAIGIEIADFKKLDPVAQYEAISKGLSEYADGAGKTAVAVALFGKSGAEQLKVMKALEEQGGRTNILTKEQIALADEYLDRQAKLRAELTLYASAIATQFVEPTNVLMSVLRDAAKELVNTGDQVNALGVNQGVQNFAENAGRALAEVIDYIKTTKSEFGALTDFLGSSIEAVKKYASFDFEGGRKVGQDFRAKYGLDEMGRKIAGSEGAAAGQTYVEKYNAELARLRNDRNRSLLNQSNNPAAGKDLRAPVAYSGATKKGGGGGSKDDPTKKILDNELKALENARKEEEDILRSRNRMLDLYNGENLISTQAYFEGKRAAQSASVSSQIALYDQEIEALKKYQSSATKATDRETAQGKINDLLEKKVRLTREAGETAIEWGFKERKAMEDLSRQINSVNAEVLELTGNLGAAARIRVDDQFGDLTKRLTAEGDSAGLAQVNRLKQLKIAQADYSQQSEGVARITEGLRIQEERIALARQLGTTGELESLAKLGESRRGALAEMEAMVAAQEAIARASGNPALVQNAERARLELEKLAAVADPLAEKFNTMFADAAGSAFSDFINGTKTAKEAFKSFTDTIFKELTNLIVKDLFKQLFSGGGTGTGGMGFDFGSLLSGLFGGGKAVGGPVSAGKMYEVNERGPELLDVNGKQMLMMGGRNGRITPNHALGGGGMAVTVNQTFASGTSKQTTDQAALSAGRAIERARRNS